MTPLALLTRWLGPWAGDRVPRDVSRHRLRVPSGDGVVEAYVYEPPQKPVGAYFVAPGLHFLGPDDTRFDRFNRVLAASGFLVMAPFVRSFLSLRLDESAYDDARAAFALFAKRARSRELSPPAVFSISFGSSLAFDLATHEGTRDDVGALVVFGGFCDFIPTVRFAVTGELGRGESARRMKRDPLNAPVVYLNVLPFLEVDGDKRALAAAWTTMVRRTWNRPELKAPGARDPFAHALAADLPASLREPFLRGCGLAAGDVEWLETGLERAGEALSFIDPGSRLDRVKARTTIVHGRDDDVIPFEESLALERALAGREVELILTGLYGHTAGAGFSSQWSRVGENARELAAMTRILSAMARLAGEE